MVLIHFLWVFYGVDGAVFHFSAFPICQSPWPLWPLFPLMKRNWINRSHQLSYMFSLHVQNLFHTTPMGSKHMKCLLQPWQYTEAEAWIEKCSHCQRRNNCFDPYARLPASLLIIIKKIKYPSSQVLLLVTSGTHPWSFLSNSTKVICYCCFLRFFATFPVQCTAMASSCTLPSKYRPR